MLLSLLVAAAAAVATPNPAPAAADSGGVVVDSAGQPIPGAVVRASGTRISVVTDQQGRFRLRGLPPGVVTLRVQAIGYDPVIHTLDLARAAANRDTVVMAASPYRLPALETEGTLAVPTLQLMKLRELSGPSFFPSVDGASFAVSGLDGLALVRFRLGRTLLAAQLPHSTALSKELGGPPDDFIPSPLGTLRGMWDACRNVPGLPLATFAAPMVDRYTVLTQSGQVWATPAPGEDRLPQPCRQAQQIELGDRVESGVGDTEGWVAVSRGPTGPVITRWSHTARRVFRISGRELFDGGADTIVVSAAAGRTLVARRHWPFGWVELDTSGEAALRSGGELPAVLRGWRAYAVLPIERGYVQTLEAPDRSRRRYLLFDRLGRLAGMPQPAVAPVLIASAPGSRQLLGLRYHSVIGRVASVLVYRY